MIEPSYRHHWKPPEGENLVTRDRVAFATVTASHLSYLADDLETAQLATGTDVLDRPRRVLDDPMSPCVGIRLAECLTDALRVDESRGMRLVVPDDAEDPEGTHG
ncbi:hypothetical protein [Streptomyces sp. NPDC058964]|uniref:hypothetical protein n=1 Tax=Streptomyces sp. NPDC058964 TaxID=3346681 RepID=UPI00368E006A